MFVVLDTNHFRELRERSEVGLRLQSRIAANRADTFSCIATAEGLSGEDLRTDGRGGMLAA